MITLRDRFNSLDERRKEEIKGRFGFQGSDNGFMLYIRQEDKGIELMWLILDPTNPVDPRYLC